MRPGTPLRPRNGWYPHASFRPSVERRLPRLSWRERLAMSMVVLGFVAMALVSVALISGAVWLIVAVVTDLARRVGL